MLKQALVPGGCVSFGISPVSNHLTVSQWLFVALAIITFIWAVVIFLFLPDTPGNAKFLSEPQKVRAVERLRSNQMVVKNNEFQWHQFREALLDPRIWLLCLYLLAVSICSSSIAAVRPSGSSTNESYLLTGFQFSQIILVGLGFDVYQANLFLIALGGIHGIFGISATYICSRFRNIRCITSAILCAVRFVDPVD